MKPRLLTLLLLCILSCSQDKLHKHSPKEMTAELDFRHLLQELRLTTPELPAIEEDPTRPEGITPIANKPGRWRLQGKGEVKRSVWGLWTNYDDVTAGVFPGPDSAKVGNYTPIDLLRTCKGKTISTVEDWRKYRRPEIVRALQDEILGTIPSGSKSPSVTFRATELAALTADQAYREISIIGEVDCSRYPELPHKPRIESLLRLPKQGGKDFPVMIIISGEESAKEKYWQIMSERGWAVCVFNPISVQPDNGAGLNDYLVGLLCKGDWRRPDTIGSIGAWIWGLQRLVDYLQNAKCIDAQRIGLFGHSRFGKTAFYAMALDERIAVGFPSDAGSMGTTMNRRHLAEDIEVIFTHWFCGNLYKFCGPLREGELMPRKVENMSVDAHSVLALCAPRPVFLNAGLGSRWTDPYGVFLTAQAGNPAYELLGEKGFVCGDRTPVVDKAYIEGRVAYRLHKEGHIDTPDWPYFFEWLESMQPM